MYLMKLILSTFIPFIREWILGNDDPETDKGSARKKNQLMVTVTTASLLILSTIGLDYLEMRETTAAQKKETEAVNDKLVMRERQLEALDNKTNQLKDEKEKLESDLRLKDIELNKVNEEFTLLKGEHRSLKKEYEDWVTEASKKCLSQASENTINDLNKKLEKLKKGRQ